MPPEKLKIAVLGAKGIPHPGGIENVMEELCSRLATKGHTVDIFVREHYMKDKPRTEYRGIGLPMSGGIHTKNLDAITHSLTALAKILSRQYDIVYFNSIGLSTLSWVPRLFGMKTVVHTHGLDWKREKWGRIARLLLRFSAYTTAKCPNRTICVCLEDKRFLESRYNAECVYLPNGATGGQPVTPDLITQYGLTGNDYLLFMSRLVPEKGCHLLIDAWQQLPDDLKKGKKLVIAGDSNHRDEYYDGIMSYRGKDDIVFTGFATGRLKEELLSNAFCFIQPSSIEGLPLSVLEALRYGLPVIVSDITENTDAVKKCGLKFKSGDAMDLLEKIREIMIMSPDDISKQREAASVLAETEYDWDRIAEKLEALLCDLLK